jgi:hypothetical protein
MYHCQYRTCNDYRYVTVTYSDNILNALKWLHASVAAVMILSGPRKYLKRAQAVGVRKRGLRVMVNADAPITR